MEYRHEFKHEISYGDLLLLRQRLKPVLQMDPHAIHGSYRVRSLYFDTPGNTALWEKLNGVSRREKFRVRYYNGDLSHIRLEKKSKLGTLCKKETAHVTREQVERLLTGDREWMVHSTEPLIQELRQKMDSCLLTPKTVVDYLREPFIYPYGNVRVTLDRDIRTGWNIREFTVPDSLTIPVPEEPIILEVKWDEFLPELVRDLVQLENRRCGTFSKYAQCRIYG